MFSRILIVTLCLTLWLPAVGAADEAGRPTQSEEARSGVADKTDHTAQPGADRETATAPANDTAKPQPLSQEDEASLSARAEEPGPEVSGGALSNLHLTYAVIALAAIILVLLIK